MRSLMCLLVCTALILCTLAPMMRSCSAAPSPARARSDAGSDAGADVSPEEMEQAGTKPAAAAAAPSPASPAASASLEEETHCTRTGECAECTHEELSLALPECASSGIKERVYCEVVSSAAAAKRNATSATDAAPPPGGVLRSYSQFVACSDSSAAALSARSGSSASFWSFMLACGVGFGAALVAMRKRRRIVMSLHHRRLDRMVNS